MSETQSVQMYDEVADVLDKLRPFLQRDGGDVELVDVEDGIVKLEAGRRLRQLPKFHNHAESRD